MSDNHWINEGCYWDENGYLLRSPTGSLFRAIQPRMAEFYLRVLDCDEVQALMDEGKLVRTRRSKDRGPAGEMLLAHEAIQTVTYPFEWTCGMFRAAASLLLEIAQRLIPRGICLHDAHFFNVLFRSGKPVFVDFTSLVPLRADEVDGFANQFESDVIQLLRLIERGHIETMRRLIRYYGRSPDRELQYHLISKRPVAKTRAGRALSEFVLPAAEIVALRARRIWHRKRQARRKLERPEQKCERLGALLNDISVPVMKGQWTDYCSGRNTLPVYDGSLASLREAIDANPKHRIVADFIDKVRPRSLVDLGCNRGMYVHLSALGGTSSIGIDLDEGALELMYRDGLAINSGALPCFADIASPADVTGGPRGKWPTLFERTRGDAALCLALTHHLLLGSPRLPMAYVAELLANYANKHALIEFVLPEDDYLVALYGEPPATYKLENFCAALRKYFPSIDIMESAFPTRRLLACARH